MREAVLALILNHFRGDSVEREISTLKTGTRSARHGLPWRDTFMGPPCHNPTPFRQLRAVSHGRTERAVSQP